MGNDPRKKSLIQWLGDKSILFLVIALFASYLIPQWLSFFLSHDYIYVNGWDEEAYLSWQGVLGAKDTPGYSVLYISWLLHLMGVAGSVQNLLFDTFITPLTVFLIYRAIRTYGRERDFALGLAMVVLFGSVLFNYANPLIAWLYGSARDLTLVMPGWERYPSALRTPNPQFSYFLVALAFYLFRRYGKAWVLLIPIPLCYYHVLVPYVLCLATAGVWHLLNRKSKISMSPLGSALLAYLAVGTGLLLQARFSHLLDPESVLRLNSYTFLEQRMPTIPLAGLAATAILFCFATREKTETNMARSIQPDLLFGLLLVMLFTSNIQLITGFMLSHKNYIDYGVNALAGVFIAVLLDYCDHHSLCSAQTLRRLLSGVLAALFVFTVPMQVVWFMRAYPGLNQVDPCTLARARKDPLHTIIPDVNLASKFAYAHARALIPPFSYQYLYPYIERQCRFYPGLAGRAFSFVQKNIDRANPEFHSIFETYLSYTQEMVRYNPLGYGALQYCKEADYKSDDFIYVPLSGARPLNTGECND